MILKDGIHKGEYFWDWSDISFSLLFTELLCFLPAIGVMQLFSLTKNISTLLIITTFITGIVVSTLHAPSFLKNKMFKKVKYFWLLVCPVINVIILHIEVFQAMGVFIKRKVLRLVKTYQTLNESELEDQLKIILDNNRKITKHIQNAKNFDDNSIGNVISEILQENQNMITILKGNV